MITIGYGLIGPFLAGFFCCIALGIIGMINLPYLFEHPIYLIYPSYAYGLLPLLVAGTYIAFCATKNRYFVPTHYYALGLTTFVLNFFLTPLLDAYYFASPLHWPGVSLAALLTCGIYAAPFFVALSAFYIVTQRTLANTPFALRYRSTLTTPESR